jgi:hypothetical protein
MGPRKLRTSDGQASGAESVLLRPETPLLIPSALVVDPPIHCTADPTGFQAFQGASRRNALISVWCPAHRKSGTLRDRYRHSPPEAVFLGCSSPRHVRRSGGEGFRGSDEAIVSDDPPGQHNPMASQGPLDGRVSVAGSRATLNRKVLERVIPLGVTYSWELQLRWRISRTRGADVDGA